MVKTIKFINITQCINEIKWSFVPEVSKLCSTTSLVTSQSKVSMCFLFSAEFPKNVDDHILFVTVNLVCLSNSQMVEVGCEHVNHGVYIKYQQQMHTPVLCFSRLSVKLTVLTLHSWGNTCSVFIPVFVDHMTVVFFTDRSLD